MLKDALPTPLVGGGTTSEFMLLGRERSNRLFLLGVF